MFHFDITMEDARLRADSLDGVSSYEVRSTDNHSGKTFTFQATPAQLGMIIAIMIHPDGEPADVDGMYPLLEPLLAGCPIECRPIP